MRAVLFPGQGAQFKGMGKDLFSQYPELTEQASAILGYSIQTLCLDDPDDLLRLTQYTQPALYVVNALSYFSWQDRHPTRNRPDFLAGHSLGEFNALLAAGCFDFDTGLKMVQRRGQLMAQINGGAMAVLQGIDATRLVCLLQEHGLEGIDLANFNSPEQIVVSGQSEDIGRLECLCDARGLSCLMVNVSGPFHSRYMHTAQRAFERFLRGFSLKNPQIPVIANINARPYRNGDTENTLGAQIARPVNWVDSIRYLVNAGVNEFLDMSPSQTGRRPMALMRLVDDIRKAELTTAG